MGPLGQPWIIDLGLWYTITVSTRALLVAAVILVIAVTPTLLDAYRSWTEAPETRPWIIVIYIVAVVVALTGWRILASDGGE